MLESLATALSSSKSEGRLSLGNRDLHAGDPITLLIHDRWVPARVEWASNQGWFALVYQGPSQEQSLSILLRPGVIVR